MTDLYSLIIAEFPELKITDEKDVFKNGVIELKDDGDGVQYISAWNYSKPLPKELAKLVRE